MQSFLCLTLSLVIYSGLLFGSTECTTASVLLPSPSGVQTTMATTSLMSKHFPNSTTANISSTSFISPNHSSIHISHSLNFSVHYSSMYMNMSSAVITSSSAVIPSSSAGNRSTHNSTIHPSFSPTPSVNISSTIVHNVSHVSSHVVPTMTFSPSPMTSVLPTSTVPPTTPPPPPPPPVGKYDVKSKNGSECLKLWMSLELTISYKNRGGKQMTTTARLPSNGTADGFCTPSLSMIRIVWSYYSFETYFHTAKKANEGWNTINITITAQTTNNSAFLNATEHEITATVKNQNQLEWLSGKVGYSLNCTQLQKLKLPGVSAAIRGFIVQPFEVKGNTFSKGELCNPQPTTKPSVKPSKKSKSNTVAIAVGCSLAGLVLIVLIGYFIGKRRSRPGTGYRKL